MSPKATAYESYGGRGIKICEQWGRFSQFLADMGPRPQGYTLERVDNDGDYTPENCRWATRKEQGNNRRCNKRVILNGENLTLAQWADKTGINYVTLRGRYDKGYTPEQILSTERFSCAPHNVVGGAANGKKQRAKTHCKHGHRRTPENIQVFTDKNGRAHWKCKECHKGHKKKWQDKQRV